MSALISNVCLEVARTNMWSNKLQDASPIIEFHEAITKISINAYEHHKSVGAVEQDVVDAVHYIAQVFSMPPIGNDANWFGTVLNTILEMAFPCGRVSGEAARFVEKLMVGIQEQCGE